MKKKKERRNRKKRRKRRTPRSPCPLLRARARRRQRQWHVSGVPCDVSPRALLPFCLRQAQDARHHGRYGAAEQLRAPLFLRPALCFLPCLQARDARHHGRYGPEGLFCWYLTMSLALCSSCCLRPKMLILRPLMLDIMAGLDQKDSFL